MEVIREMCYITSNAGKEASTERGEDIQKGCQPEGRDVGTKR